MQKIIHKQQKRLRSIITKCYRSSGAHLEGDILHLPHKEIPLKPLFQVYRQLTTAK